MATNKGNGVLGYGSIPDAYAFLEVMQNMITQGCMAVVSSDASSQITGTGASDYNVNMTGGLIAVGGTVEELALTTDIDLDSNATNVLTNGQARWYTYVRYLSLADGVKRTKLYKGTIAAVADAVRVTDAEIEATMADNTPYVRIFDAKAHRDGDESVAVTFDNSVRPALCRIRPNA